MTTDATTYAVTVQGHLDLHWADWLDDVTITHQDDGTSTLVAQVADQAALHGLLARLRDLGTTLIAVIPAPAPPPAPTHHRPPATQKE